MKAFIVVLTALFALNAQAAPKKIWTCLEDGDVDYVRIELYKYDNGKMFTMITQVAGDGDSGGLDIIEVQPVNNGNERFRSYTQVGTVSRTPDGFAKYQPNHQVRGFRLELPLIGEEGFYRGTRGPIGKGEFKNYLPLVCSRVITSDV